MLVDGPLPIRVFEGGQVLDPIAAVEVDGGAFIVGYVFDFGLVDVSAYDVVEVLFDGEVGGYFFEVAHPFEGAFDVVFDFSGEAHAFHSDGHEELVEPSIEEDEQVVAFAAESGEDLGPAFGHPVEYIAVEYPVGLAIDFEDVFVGEDEAAEAHVGVLAEGVVVVARDVDDPCPFLDELDDVADDLHMGGWKILLSEVPNVDDVAIEDEEAGLDVGEVLEDFVCVASIGAEVEVAEYTDV